MGLLDILSSSDKAEDTSERIRPVICEDTYDGSVQERRICFKAEVCFDNLDFIFIFSVGWLKNQFAVFKEMVKQERKKDGFCVFLKSRAKSEDA